MLPTPRTTPVLLTALAALAACADSVDEWATPHPSAFVGRWVRLREDGTWGDTMEFRPDGSVRGSTGYNVPPALQWEVTRDSSTAAGAAEPRFCARVGQMGGFCRPFRVQADEFELIGGPGGNTRFRRVR